MRTTTVVTVCCLAMGGCSSGKPSDDGTWRASVNNGDKPGIVIELTKASGLVTGFIFVTDPQKPNELGSGLKCPMEIKKVGPDEIQFGVQWTPMSHDDLKLRFSSKIQGDVFSGIMMHSDDTGEPREYNFVRVK